LALGVIALAAFMWSMANGQYDDLDGAAERILFEDHDRPMPDHSHKEHPAPRVTPSHASLRKPGI
jgi:cbb3-type cytochrome oxidase maturation protein